MKVKVSTGAVDLLWFLAVHEIPRTIATVSEKTDLDFSVEHLHPNRWFDMGLVVSDDGTRPGKPAPDIYPQAVRHLSLVPARCVVMEDAQSGIEAAGMGYIVALEPVEPHQHLAQLVGVSYVIANLQELPREGLPF